MAKICAVVGIICAAISVLLGCFCGMYCLLFAIPAAICSVATFKKGREASLDEYYNKGRREAIAKDEKQSKNSLDYCPAFFGTWIKSR